MITISDYEYLVFQHVIEQNPLNTQELCGVKFINSHTGITAVIWPSVVNIFNNMGAYFQYCKETADRIEAGELDNVRVEEGWNDAKAFESHLSQIKSVAAMLN